MEKISTYPFQEKRDVMETSWGRIIAKRISIEIHISDLGVIEVHGWISVKKYDDKILIDGTDFDEPSVLIKAELKP